MSKTILANVNGFTPCIDVLIQEYDLITAAVFGRVWRYCQMERGVCQASLETIADDTGLSYNTVLRHIKMLVDGGYLEDASPDLRYKPHTYRDTGKIHLAITATAGLSERETSSTTERDEVSQKERLGLPEREIKIVLKKDSLEDSEEDSLAPTAQDYKARTLNALAKGLQQDATFKEVIEAEFNIMPNWSRKDWRDCIYFLKRYATPELVKDFATWWRAEDWRGKKGQAPTAGQITELWPQAMYSEKKEERTRNRYAEE